MTPTKRAMAKRSHKCTYVVGEKGSVSFDAACGHAATLSIARRESVCIETMVAGKVVERIDVTAALSTDPIE